MAFLYALLRFVASGYLAFWSRKTANNYVICLLSQIVAWFQIMDMHFPFLFVSNYCIENRKTTLQTNYNLRNDVFFIYCCCYVNSYSGTPIITLSKVNLRESLFHHFFNYLLTLKTMYETMQWLNSKIQVLKHLDCLFFTNFF